MSQLYIHANLLRIQPPRYVQTRKCDANADVNGIRTKISMSPSAEVGEHKSNTYMHANSCWPVCSQTYYSSKFKMLSKYFF